MHNYNAPLVHPGASGGISWLLRALPGLNSTLVTCNYDAAVLRGKQKGRSPPYHSSWVSQEGNHDAGPSGVLENPPPPPLTHMHKKQPAAHHNALGTLKAGDLNTA
jgi:hypothetical protein